MFATKTAARSLTETVLSQAKQARPISHEAMQRLQGVPHLEHKRLLGPGPTNMHAEVAQALTWPQRGHMHPDFFQIMSEVRSGIQYMFETENPLSLAVSGPGHSAMEAAMVNLIEQGDRVSVMRNGFWSGRATTTAENAGAQVHEQHTPIGNVFTLEQIEQELLEHKPKLLVIVHGESSTGVLQPLQGIADLCHAHDCLFVVDTVASICAAPFNMDQLQVDCVYSGTQKALGGPPGISPISFNDRAWHKIANRQTRPRSLMLDMNELGTYWGCFTSPRKYHHTAPIPLVYGMRAALSLLAREGLHQVIQRHYDNAALLYAGLADIGLTPYVPDVLSRMSPITTINVPAGVDCQQVIDDMWQMLEHLVIITIHPITIIILNQYFSHGIEIWGGIGETAGKMWRVGLMGNNSRPEVVRLAVNALYRCLQQQNQQNEQALHA